MKTVTFKAVFEVSQRPAPFLRYPESPLVTHLITTKISKFQEFRRPGPYPEKDQIWIFLLHYGAVHDKAGPGIDSLTNRVPDLVELGGIIYLYIYEF